MVEYLKTKKGYFYKLKKNGEKKRISQEEYNKKNKTRKNKKMICGAGESIDESDIMYKDDLVCILKPEVKKGIIIWTHFTQPEEMGSLCEFGLKTGKQLQIEGIKFGRRRIDGEDFYKSRIHPYIFFKAPYYSRDIDYTSVETEINSSYGEGQIGTEPRVFIRVDPDRTFVFASEIRSDDNFKNYKERCEYLDKSKKTLSAYLEIIRDNLPIEKNVKPDQQILYSFITGKVHLLPFLKHSGHRIGLSEAPTNMNSEILVSIPHLTPNYFVLCATPYKKIFYNIFYDDIIKPSQKNELYIYNNINEPPDYYDKNFKSFLEITK